MDEEFASKVGEWGILRNEGILVMRGMVLKWGVDAPGDPSNEGDGFEMGG